MEEGAQMLSHESALYFFFFWRVAHSKWLALAQVAGYGLREPSPRDFA
jgi:hypothetical protein